MDVLRSHMVQYLLYEEVSQCMVYRPRMVPAQPRPDHGHLPSNLPTQPLASLQLVQNMLHALENAPPFSASALCPTQPDTGAGGGASPTPATRPPQRQAPAAQPASAKFKGISPLTRWRPRPLSIPREQVC